MRKSFTIALLLFTTTITWGQITIGPRVGYNMASQFKSDFTVPKFDWALGGALNISITRNFSVQGEVLLTKKGYREEYKGKEIFDQLTANYIEIPAMAKYSFNGVNWGFYGMGGVYWSYWTKAVYQSSVDGENIITEQPDFKTAFNNPNDATEFKDVRSDFGAVIEAGVTYDNLGSGVLALGLRYSHGFIATRTYETPSADDVLRYNRVLTLSLTYFFYL